jgi:hypothetical protein
VTINSSANSSPPTNQAKKENNTTTTTTTTSYRFDRAFGPLASQDDVFAEVFHLVEGCVRTSKSACVFAYGPSGVFLVLLLVWNFSFFTTILYL